MLLTESIDRFLQSKEADDRSDRTVGSYRQRLAGFSSFAIARSHCHVGEITPDDVDDWAVALRRQKFRFAHHPRRKRQNGGLSKATRAGRIQAVKALFDWCVKRGHLPRSPAAHLERPRVGRSARSKLMAPADLRRMEAAARERAEMGQPRDLALLCFIADTGCRRGEVETLCISDLDLTHLGAWVNGKTDLEREYRYVQFAPTTGRALASWLDVRPPVEHDRVFLNLSLNPRHRYQPLSGDGIYQVFKRLARAAGVKGRYNPHALRHLVGQHYTDQDNLEIARQKLGHKHITTTARHYAHQGSEEVRRATLRHSLLND